MSNQLVSETEVEDALQWLGNNDIRMAEAHALVDKLDELKKVTIAELMQISKKSSEKAKESEALSSQEYRAFLEERYKAVKAERMLKLRAAHMNTKIDVYRTISANQRKVGV